MCQLSSCFVKKTLMREGIKATTVRDVCNLEYQWPTNAFTICHRVKIYIFCYYSYPAFTNPLDSCANMSIFLRNVHTFDFGWGIIFVSWTDFMEVISLNTFLIHTCFARCYFWLDENENEINFCTHCTDVSVQ